MRETWTDVRLDGFAAQVDKRFDGVDKRFDILELRVDNGFNRVDADLRALREETKAEFVAVRGEMSSRFDNVDKRFERVESRIDDLHRTLLQLGGGAIATMVVGFLGVIVTQL